MPLVPHRRPLRLLLTAATVAGLAAGGVIPAAAQPSSQELRGQRAGAQAELDALMMHVAEVVEDYNEATVALEAAEAALAATETEHAALRTEVIHLTRLAEDHVRTIHKLGPSLELSSILVSGNPTDAGAKAATLRRVLAGQQADLEGLAAARTAIAVTEDRLAEQQQAARAQAEQVDRRREELDALVASQQDQIADLEQEIAAAEEREEAERRRAEEERLRREAAERARLAAEEQQRQAQERREAAAAEPAPVRAPRADPAPSESAPPEAKPSEPKPEPAPAPSTRRSAQTAVDTALAQVGKPYRYGGSGPNNFDCSGLTSYAWRAAGVEITRTSRSQYAYTKRISRGDVQPGDLIFYGRSVSRISHVAMYIGNGKVVEAPYSGQNVRIRSDGMARKDIVGYGRV